MPKRVRPYGSALDAEAAALSRAYPGSGDDFVSDMASTMTVREIADRAAEAIRALNDLAPDAADFAGPDDVREVTAGLERMSQGLPQLCEQLARILVVQREHGQIADGSGEVPDFWVIEAVEALASAGQAADMLTAALHLALNAATELTPGS
jgi:hypothetical protein